MPTELDDLRAQLAAERAAHAAEVAGLRKHLSTVLGILPQDFRGSTFWEEDDGYFVEHQWHKEARAALAANPSPLVAAVEQIAKAVEATICGSCGNRIGWQGEFDAAQKRLGRDDWRTCSGCQSTRAALAAYRAALGEADA